MKTTLTRVGVWAFRAAIAALGLAALTGFRCPTPGCPLCRAVGK